MRPARSSWVDHFFLEANPMRIRSMHGFVTAAALGAAFAVAGVAAGQQTGQMETKGKEQIRKLVIEKVHLIHQGEIAYGQLALRQAQSPEVKRLAQMLVQDHQERDRKILEIAQKHGVKLDERSTVPAGMPRSEEAVGKEPAERFGQLIKEYTQRVQQETNKRLQGLQGVEFDQAYAHLMIVEHTQAIAFLGAAREYVVDENVQKLLDESIPKLEQHRDAAINAAKAVSKGGQQLGR
jgi:predicted outer membrane protein